MFKKGVVPGKFSNACENKPLWRSDNTFQWKYSNKNKSKEIMNPHQFLQFVIPSLVIDFSTKIGVPSQQEFIVHCHTETKIDWWVSGLVILGVIETCLA